MVNVLKNVIFKESNLFNVIYWKLVFSYLVKLCILLLFIYDMICIDKIEYRIEISINVFNVLKKGFLY